MKTIITMLAISVIALTSCKKNRTCQCVYTDGDVETYNIVNQSKKGAKNICQAKSSSNRNCSLE